VVFVAFDYGGNDTVLSQSQVYGMEPVIPDFTYRVPLFLDDSFTMENPD